MTASELLRIAQSARCRLFGLDDAGNAGHRAVLAAMILCFDESESALLCEPSLARSTTRPPDIVLIDPEVGVHVLEVKGVTLDQIEELEAGGAMRIRYASGVRSRNAVAQVRAAMFDIKDATTRAHEGDVQIPFRYWVVFPAITRDQWITRFGQAAFLPREFIFADELGANELRRRFGKSDGRLNEPVNVCPLSQLECVWRAFGDTSVLYASPEDRKPRCAGEGTLGEHFDQIAESYKSLSEEQKRLSEMNWDRGPRLVRGVAGSGKTVVLANNLARRLERMQAAAEQDLFADGSDQPRLLAVCFNRTLAPFIRKKIELAYQQRTGQPIPAGRVDVLAFNSLMWELTNRGLWQYQTVNNVDGIVRAMQYLGDVQQIRQRDPQLLRKVAYDAIYVDEGQDFLEAEFKLLSELCRVDQQNPEPNLYVFYDDAQNLYGRSRPNWNSIGLNVRGGRSFVMTECFRNTRPILEAGFNTLYGTCAEQRAQRPTREYGDLAALEQKSLIVRDEPVWRVNFARRSGVMPSLHVASDPLHEAELIAARLHWLLKEQEVRPEDILVLSFTKQRIRQLAEVLRRRVLPGVSSIQLPIEEKEKDHRLGQKGRLTLSTVASAKGYDAYCVLLVSANDFDVDIKGRASFYVACTRAIEHLDVFGYAAAGLLREFAAVIPILEGKGRATGSSAGAAGGSQS